MLCVSADPYGAVRAPTRCGNGRYCGRFFPARTMRVTDESLSGPALDWLRVVRKRASKLLAIRAQGAGGQNVNKESNAVHRRFDIRASSLPEAIKQRLLAKRDQRTSDDGMVIIKAQTIRSLERNRADALARLDALVILSTCRGP